MVETASLREVARIDRKSVAPEDIETGSNYVGLENIESGGRLINVGTVANGELASSKFQFTSEHVLYGKLRPYLAKIALPEFDGICSTDIVPVLPGSKLDRRFLVHFLRQPNKVRLANSLATGANLPRLSPTALGEMVVPLPPLEEQRRIAAILDNADELRTKRRQALAHLDILTQSMFHDLLDQNSGSERRRLEEVATAVIDCPHTTPRWIETGVTCLRTSNLGFGGWDWNDHRFVSEGDHHERSKRAYLEPEDIILSREGTVGVAAIVPEGMVASLGQRLVQVRPNPEIVVPLMLLHYLLFTLSPVRISNLMVGATSKHLNVKDLRNLAVPVPPLAAQREFAVRISAIERLKNQYRIQLSEIDVLFASLQHRAFKGEL